MIGFVCCIDDHTRVKFLPQPGHEDEDEYINANFIDGFKKRRAYIGTQGPLPITFHSFWRMIWEQEVRIIVMITNLIERGRVSTRIGIKYSQLRELENSVLRKMHS